MKSLTSSTHVVTSMASALGAAQSMPPHALPPVINGMANGNSNKDGSALRAITLTPPTSIRLTSSRNKNGTKPNGIVQSTSGTTTVNNSLNNNFHEQFTSDPAKVKNLNDARQWLYDNRDKIENNNNNNFNTNNMSNGLTNGTTTNHNHHHQHNNHYPNGLLSNHDTKNSLLSNGLSIDNNNKFTPDTDFVADFGSASIFDATALSSSTTPAAATINHNNCINNNNNNHNGCNNNSNNSNKLVNGTVTGANTLQNGSTATTVKNANADFADFDHNPIFNASGNLFYIIYISYIL